jgi:hypothetical protein
VSEFPTRKVFSSLSTGPIGKVKYVKELLLRKRDVKLDNWPIWEGMVPFSLYDSDSD